MSDELVPISGEVVKAPPAADMRHEDENPDAVMRVFIRYECAGGRIREYEAREPQGFEIRESMSVQPARLPGAPAILAGSVALPSLSLSFTAHPRYNLHIRTEATAPGEFEGITYG
jgi:hypothetical protein